jgi:hypothetical protein
VPTVNKHAIVANDDDVALIAGLPVPCIAGIVGPTCMGATVIDDGRIEFTAEEPGDYTIWMSAPGQSDWSVMITAVVPCGSRHGAPSSLEADRPHNHR